MKIGLRYQIYSLFSRGLAERESSLFFLWFRPETSGVQLIGTVVFFVKKQDVPFVPGCQWTEASRGCCKVVCPFDIACDGLYVSGSRQGFFVLKRFFLRFAVCLGCSCPDRFNVHFLRVKPLSYVSMTCHLTRH